MKRKNDFFKFSTDQTSRSGRFVGRNKYPGYERSIGTPGEIATI